MLDPYGRALLKANRPAALSAPGPARNLLPPIFGHRPPRRRASPRVSERARSPRLPPITSLIPCSRSSRVALGFSCRMDSAFSPRSPADSLVALYIDIMVPSTGPPRSQAGALLSLAMPENPKFSIPLWMYFRIPSWAGSYWTLFLSAQSLLTFELSARLRTDSSSSALSLLAVSMSPIFTAS